MKKVTVKNYLLTCAQLPVVAALFVVACIEWVLAWCLAYLSNPMSTPPTLKLGERNSQRNIRERNRQYSMLNRN